MIRRTLVICRAVLSIRLLTRALGMISPGVWQRVVADNFCVWAVRGAGRLDGYLWAEGYTLGR